MSVTEDDDDDNSSLCERSVGERETCGAYPVVEGESWPEYWKRKGFRMRGRRFGDGWFALLPRLLVDHYILSRLDLIGMCDRNLCVCVCMCVFSRVVCTCVYV